MKRLLLILVLTFSFQSLSKADDIKDFQIEGMSLGDSALDFATKSEIISLKNSYKDKGYIYNSKKFYSITFRNHPNLNIYENIQFILKDNDKKYKIYGIVGVIEYIKNIDQCYEDLDIIETDLDKVFTNADKNPRSRRVASADETGKSTIESVAYFIQNDVVVASCADWFEKINIADALRVNINSENYNLFLRNEAYK
tara:strand:+ start:37 stop:630 length:594 start_codon:yes stop_codon:yes gene_type:complete